MRGGGVVELPGGLVGEHQARTGRRELGQRRRVVPVRRRAPRETWRRASSRSSRPSASCARGHGRPSRFVPGEQERERDVLDHVERRQEAGALEDIATGPGRSWPVGTTRASSRRRTSAGRGRPSGSKRRLARARRPHDRDAMRTGPTSHRPRAQRPLPTSPEASAPRLDAGDQRRSSRATTRPSASCDDAVGGLGDVRRCEWQRRCDAVPRSRSQESMTWAPCPVELAGRLVGQQDGGIVREGDGEPGPAGLAAGQVAARQCPHGRSARPRRAARVSPVGVRAAGEALREQDVARHVRCSSRLPVWNSMPIVRARSRAGSRSGRRQTAFTGDAHAFRRRVRRARPGRRAASTCPTPTGPMTATISPASTRKRHARAARASRRRPRGRSDRGPALRATGVIPAQRERVGDGPPRIDVVGPARCRRGSGPPGCRPARTRSARRLR